MAAISATSSAASSSRLGAATAQLGVAMHLAAVDPYGRPSGILGEPDIEGAKLLLVNDVVTTGHGLRTMAEAARERGGEVAAAAWFLTRSRLEEDPLPGVPCLPVVSWELPCWDSSVCSGCGDRRDLQHAYDLN
jgi:orotate phosphoribosyltransferase